MHFISSIYRIEPSRLARVAAGKWLGRWWWAFVLPLVVCAALAVSDARFVIVGLMLIFIVWPMALTMAWFWLCGSPNVIDNIRQAQVAVSDDGIVFAYNPSSGSPDVDAPEPVVRRYRWSDFKSTETDGALTLFYLREPDGQFLAVPTSALSDESLLLINDKNNKPSDD